MKSKRFFITRTKTENILVQGEKAYRMETNIKKTVTKKNKNITMIKPEIIQPNTIIPKASKLKDVSALLQKHFGQHWQNLQFLQYYKHLVANMNNDLEMMISEDHEEECSNLCEPGFVEVPLRISN